MKLLCLLFCFVFFFAGPAFGQQNQNKKRKKIIPPFKWVNPIPDKKKVDRVFHKTFKSPSMKVEVGYCIYLPAEYDSAENKRYPVVYYLHGGIQR